MRIYIYALTIITREKVDFRALFSVSIFPNTCINRNETYVTSTKNEYV